METTGKKTINKAHLNKYEAKKKEYNKIIKEGTIRSQIKLLFEDIALQNVKLYTPIQMGELGGLTTRANLKKGVPDVFLTPEQEENILKNMRGTKEAKYYKKLTEATNTFLLFKPTISTYVASIKYLRAEINNKVLIIYKEYVYIDLINDIINKVEEPLAKSLVINVIEEVIPKSKATLKDNIQQKKQLQIKLKEIPIIKLIKELNKILTEAKEFFEGMKLFLKKELPIKAYRDFIKEEEAIIKKELLSLDKIIGAYVFLELTNNYFFLTPQDFTLIKNTVENNVKLYKEGRGDLFIPERFQILKWNEIKVEITDEDIETIKESGK